MIPIRWVSKQSRWNDPTPRDCKTKITEVETNYADLRRMTPSDDRSPELYLLAALFALEKFDRVETVLKDLRSRYPGSIDVIAIGDRYARAIERARKAAKAPQ